MIIQVSFAVVWSQRAPTCSPRNNPIYDRSELYDTFAILRSPKAASLHEASRDPRCSDERSFSSRVSETLESAASVSTDDAALDAGILARSRIPRRPLTYTDVCQSDRTHIVSREPRVPILPSSLLRLAGELPAEGGIKVEP